ncbi:biotin--[acetyl-CoA-carboxylase] ligase [Candidatus Bipolaricaulota bacterium]|nr:biotin--[acetyl-CoA-carboxylase] ligase [Candidatus Bipolaricaulota bacterium]
MSEREALKIVELDFATSTQDVARSLLGTDRCPDIIVAKTQTAGRGRCGRSWSSPIGGMYATMIVPTSDLLFARAALAVTNALRQIGIHPSIKWPNDLLVAGKKMAGLLVEVIGDRALVGVGINLDAAPVPEATCVGAYVAPPPCASALALKVWQAWPHGAAAEILLDYRRQCATLGRRVRVDRGTPAGESVCGIAVDIDETGALVVAGDEGEAMPPIALTLTCGDCRHLDPEEGIWLASQERSA